MRSIKFEHLVITGLFGFLFFKNCEVPKFSSDETISETTTDTIYVTKNASIESSYAKFKYQEPETVYVKEMDTMIEKISEEDLDLLAEEERSELKELKEYRDTLQNEDLKIFSKIITDGRIYENKLDYELHQPFIKETTTITNNRTRSGVYLFSTVGGNKTEFNTLTLGVQYVHKNKWFVGYGANFAEPSKITNTITAGVKLF